MREGATQRGWRALLALATCAHVGCASPDRGEPLTWVDREAGPASATDERPLIVALHGRGDRPERFREVFDDLDVPARVLLVRAPIDEGRGRAWFVFRGGFGAAMDAVETLLPRIARCVSEYREGHPTRGRPLLVGFSQGAMIAYAYASRRPDEMSAVFPVSGGLPERFRPARGAHLPPIRAIHGTADEVIESQWSTDSVSELRGLGVDASLTLVDGAPHWMTAPMREALTEQMHPYLAR